MPSMTSSSAGRAGVPGGSAYFGIAVARIHEEAAALFLGGGKARDPFHPAGAVPTRNDQAGGEAVDIGRLAIHFEGEEGGGVHGLFHRHAADEIGRLHDTAIGAIDFQEFRAGIDAGEFEDVAEARPGPLRVADRAASPLDAGELGRIEGAPVAGAFERGGDGVLGELLELREGDFGRLGDHAVDGEAVGRGVDRGGARKMLAHKEGVYRGDPGIEVLDGRLEILRAVVMKDEGTLAGDRDPVGRGEFSGCRRGE